MVEDIAQTAAGKPDVQAAKALFAAAEASTTEP
jgi:hypothetical protein